MFKCVQKALKNILKLLWHSAFEQFLIEATIMINSVRVVKKGHFSTGCLWKKCVSLKSAPNHRLMCPKVISSQEVVKMRHIGTFCVESFAREALGQVLGPFFGQRISFFLNTTATKRVILGNLGQKRPAKGPNVILPEMQSYPEIAWDMGTTF